MIECMKKHIITIIAASLIVVAVIVTIVVVVVKNKADDEEKEVNPPTPTPEIDLSVLLKDSEFKKPNKKMNAEFELVKMGNGLTGLLISDPYADKSHIQFTMKYGSYIDTDSGISHFGEHMVLQGSEKYDSLYPFFNKFFGIKNVQLNAITKGNSQLYYITLPFNYLFDEAMNIMVDAFRYPLYRADRIKNEIQAVNHEFYDSVTSPSLEENIIRQLSSNKTSFNGMACGNNQSLKPSESELLSKKLKGYHMVIKNPKNMFFVLYTNKSISESEEYAKKYLNYKMHIFPKEEFDEADKRKLEQNIKDIESIEIFDENIYKHGIYYNTYQEINELSIYYYIGKLNYTELKFHIFDYFGYLFKSESLFKVLKGKNYIENEEGVSLVESDYLENNDYFIISTTLTEEGLKNINDVLLIINKYLDIMKENGYKKQYYNNYIQYKNNEAILTFTKDFYFKRESYEDMCFNYLYFKPDEILLSGDFLEENYKEDILKKYLNLINYDKSFYTLNTRTEITELTHLNEVLDKVTKEKYKYFDTYFMVGTFPDSLDQKVKDKNIKIENLQIRDINTYFSSKYNERVVPCYKETSNTCKEKNEFDYTKDENYIGTQIEDERKDSYKTYYQIDKSSESHLVYSYLEFSFDDLEGLTYQVLRIEKIYMKYIIAELLEINDAFDYEFDESQLILKFKFITFSDNTEKIINRFIDLITRVPSEEDFDFSKILTTSSIYQEKSRNLQKYAFAILNAVMTQDAPVDYNIIIDNINKTEYETFKNFHVELLKSIYLIKFIIAGNINKETVQNIHNHIKKNIDITASPPKKILILKDEQSVVLDFYLKSQIKEPENGIFVAYVIPQEMLEYFKIFQACFTNIALNYLRFNYTNGYTPSVLLERGYFIIYEQGLYKEVDSMEDDINKVLMDVIEGRINVQNYKEILDSYNLNIETKIEKTFDNLFDDFTSEEETPNGYLNDEVLPKTFAELVEIVKPVFINPTRISILIARNTLTKKEYDAMILKRSQIKEYVLNKNITISHRKLD